ncbi:MAG: MmgE/PrpD family protein, partial [Gammaproteobacteria bacterium]|nr:MmgE/PrpD family protein [Gammaproteobacteria bacterium]
MKEVTKSATHRAVDLTAAHGAADPIASALAEFAFGLQGESIPAAIAERARHLMLDAIGCAMAARGEDFASRYATAVRDLAGADATAATSSGAGHGGRGVIGFADRLPLRDAMMLNGVLAHGLDYDDTHMAGVIHLSVSVLPAVLAVAASRGASMGELLSAYVAGLESGARIASVSRGGLHAQGFHPTGVVGAFACALATGRLIGLDARQLVGAQGIALSMASGSLQFLEDGAWTKRLHPGWAAQAGYQAASLARHDIPAPDAPYTGRYGLFKSYLGSGAGSGPDLSLGSAGLPGGGQVGAWELENIAIKPFPMCHFVHAAADAAIALRSQGVTPGRIASIEVLMPEGTMPVVCDPIEAKRRPQTDYEAKFSVPYAVASGLLRGRVGLQELLPAALREAEVLALMDRVSCRVDPDATYPRHYSGEVRVRLDDGTELRQREAVNRGHAERPLSNDEVRAK